MCVGILVLSVFGFLSNVQAESPVQLDVYYESMCPDSGRFFKSQLAPSYEKLATYLNIDFIPYGNAHYRGQRDEYTFTCQHGAEECYGNMVQTCYITLVNNTESRIQFVNCAFDHHDQMKSIDKCISDIDLHRQVKKCVSSSMGINLEYEMAKKTDDLEPQHNFIPWITVNGKGSTTLNNRANENLMSVICDELTDPKPSPCNKNKWNFYKRKYYL